MRLDAGVNGGIGADGAGDGAGGDLGPRRFQALPAALELGVKARQLEAEGGELGVDAVAAADADVQLVLPGPALEDLEKLVHVGPQQVRGLGQLQGQTGVEHVGRGQPQVHVAAVVADLFRQLGQEGDDVVLDPGLDFFDPRDAGLGVGLVAALADRPGRLFRDGADLGQGVAGMGLDLEPEAELVGGLPDGGHLGAAVAVNHGASRT